MEWLWLWVCELVWLWLWVWGLELVLLGVPLVNELRWDQGERVISEDVVGVQGVFLGLRDLSVSVHVRPLFWDGG